MFRVPFTPRVFQLIKITVTDRAGQQHEVAGFENLSIMETLRELDYGVSAICGGQCACATCHVYINQSWQEKLPAQSTDEEDLLGDLDYRQENSRLSCQIILNPVLEGIHLTLAPEE